LPITINDWLIISPHHVSPVASTLATSLTKTCTGKPSSADPKNRAATPNVASATPNVAHYLRGKRTRYESSIPGKTEKHSEVMLMAMMRRPPGAGATTDLAAELGAAPLLLTARQAASLCSKSLRTWRTWDAIGWIPRPIRIGRSTLWRADEIRAWIAAGCPRRAEWEART
jgi:predicted DNA-binding transcriptional regulator AlpA